MGLPIVTLSRLTDRQRLRAASPWRMAGTLLLLAIVLPIALVSAVATLPIALGVGLVVAARRVWQWPASPARRPAGSHRR
ncbi:MAG: hypothetical protein KF788_18320 [Piscinibacter sp.]|nr:hypothetical protein [Piscinibacter sp.]